MLTFITAHIGVLLPILFAKICALIGWAVNLHFKVKALQKEFNQYKQDNKTSTEQLREDIKGIQQNIKELTINIAHLVGTLEGAKIIRKD